MDMDKFYTSNKSWCKDCGKEYEKSYRRKVVLSRGVKSSGTLYIIGNKNYPNYYKVGLIRTGSIKNRLNSMNGSCPFRSFKAMFTFNVNSHVDVYESCSHRLLKINGMSIGSEWFSGDLEEIKKCVNDVILMEPSVAYDAYRDIDE
jgi:hypothetical protein